MAKKYTGKRTPIKASKPRVKRVSASSAAKSLKSVSAKPAGKHRLSSRQIAYIVLSVITVALAVVLAVAIVTKGFTGHAAATPCAHDHVETLPYVAPDCGKDKDGLTSGKRCKDCGKILEPQQIIEPKHHEKVLLGYPATCTSAGKTDGVLCTYCHKMIIAQEILPALGGDHDFENGKCTICGAEAYDKLTADFKNDAVTLVTTQDLQILKPYLKVELHCIDGTTVAVNENDIILSGDLTKVNNKMQSQITVGAVGTRLTCYIMVHVELPKATRITAKVAIPNGFKVTTDTPLAALRDIIVCTVVMSDGTQHETTEYALKVDSSDGQLKVGENDIIIEHGGFTATIKVTAESGAPAEHTHTFENGKCTACNAINYVGISAALPNPNMPIYNTTDPEDLKDYITVTATDDGGELVELDGTLYELSGNLNDIDADGMASVLVTHTNTGLTTTLRIKVIIAGISNIYAIFNQKHKITPSTRLEDIYDEVLIYPDYSDGTEHVNPIKSGYTLEIMTDSGKFEYNEITGKNTVKVTYYGFTTTFEVKIDEDT